MYVSSSTVRNCGSGDSRFESGIVGVRARRTSCEEEEGSDLRQSVRARFGFLQNSADLFDTIAELIISSRRSTATAAVLQREFSAAGLRTVCQATNAGDAIRRLH